MLTSIVQLARLARVGFVLAREGAFALVDPSELPAGAKPLLWVVRLIERRGAGDGAQRLAAALTRLGPSYVKFGQFLATRPDVVGVRVARDLEALQDRMPAFGRAEAAAVVEASFGLPLDRVFTSFSEPVAAASIAQVHRATVRGPDGDREMAVKVLRPGVRARFRKDLKAMAFAARMIENWLPETKRLKPIGVVETLARSVSMEMDLRLEAAALSEMAENTREDVDFRTPVPDWERTARDVLTMEWIDGLPLNALPAIEEAGYDRVALARSVIQSFLRHALRDGFFHADMHPGNLFVDTTGRLCAVDFGIMGRLGLKERRFLAEILLGFITRNYRRVAEVHFEAGYVPPRHSVDDFAQAIRAIGEPIHDRTADQISMAKLLTLLFEITGIFDMTTRTELVMLQKTMVVVEGVARNLDPRLDMWRTSEPVVREWIERNLGPIGRLEQAGRGALDYANLFGHLPSLVNRAERLVIDLEESAVNGFRLAPESLAGIGRAEAERNRWSTVALWIIAICVFAATMRILSW
ncbi:2-polyprenylphenol 6-hydroxylase [Alsobacter soli]|uniref:2-polyprenylphenol 6-hydroxylase n=1 Tax=Alsobacter soli TaxID=2109933 RepID=A0A2T1HQE9_9HYPH|nr:2-polyprenylphenol 6-hydroxylase [Alsobacter soli]PSC03881.1 2-polyprenylphenol 6-hydroxylase [Alsobacter soli]